MRKKNKTKVKIKTPEDAGSAAVETEEVVPVDEMEALRRELADAKDQYLRSMAEQQNMRKRFAQEKTDAVRFAGTSLIKDLLAVLDDFERTLEHGDQGGDALLEGVKLIHQNFVKAIKTHDIQTIDPLGEAFDPQFHEAMLQQPSEDKAPGTVLQVVQRGYRLHERVLRPAKVIIAAAKCAEDATETAKE